MGSAGFFIDLAIRDPERRGRYLLGIECDGATYHSARSARDRDRLRQQVLEGLGWKIHRIWSTDWFKKPNRELEKVEEAIRNAVRRETRRKSHNPIHRAEPLQRVESETRTDRPTMELYRLASPAVRLYDEDLHQVRVDRLMNWIVHVVEIESPVHLIETARRIANAAGLKQVGSRILPRVEEAVRMAAQSGKIAQKGEFLWRLGHDKVPLRKRTNLPVGMRRIELIAPEEIGAALLEVVRASHGINEDGAITEARKLFGFKRTGPDIRASIEEVVRKLVRDGVLERRGDFLQIGESSI